MAIKDWPADQRPREKLTTQGAQALNDCELLAIFLRTGLPGIDAVSLAQKLLQQFGSLRELIGASQREFCAANGLGPAKYVQLQASIEMARRCLTQELQQKQTVQHAAVAKQLALTELGAEPNEVFAALWLDNQHQLLKFQRLFQGSIAQASVHPRVVVQSGLAVNAAAVILCHNHPSGVTEPSTADIQITAQLREALLLFDIRILDHLVVGGNQVCSMTERGLI